MRVIKVNADLQQQIIDLYQCQVQTIDSVAKQLGLRPCTVWYWVRKLGIRRDRAEVNKLRASKSHPQSIAVRAKISQSHKGLRPGPETRVKLSESHKGKTPSLETRQKMSTALKKQSKNPEARAKRAKATALAWEDRDSREKRIKSILKALNKRPNKLEQRLIEISEKYKLPYRYSGDGSVIIAGVNPDFINCDGDKKVIEIFGIAFHDPQKTFLAQISLIKQEEYRKAIYASLGFDCLVLWDTELDQMPDEQVATTIKKFTKSRHKPSPQLGMRV